MHNFYITFLLVMYIIAQISISAILYNEKAFLFISFLFIVGYLLVLLLKKCYRRLSKNNNMHLQTIRKFYCLDIITIIIIWSFVMSFYIYLNIYHELFYVNRGIFYFSILSAIILYISSLAFGKQIFMFCCFKFYRRYIKSANVEK